MSQPDLPERIGPYRIVDCLGEGGMGTVFAGLDADGKKVAIKVIKPAFADDRRYRARFEAEVKAAQRVRPFCTAPVLDADPAADPPYLVTEYVNGPSLKKLVTETGPLRGADLEAVAIGIATALTAVHDAGIIHRDLKPANVLLSTFGPRVIDFGIARSPDAENITTTGGLIGSPAYMAPEQLDGRGAVPASDVFAWGATVAFAARGEPCFGGGPVPAVINRIINGKPDLSGLDGVLLSAVRAALEKDPERRPSAHSLLERLISGGARVPAAVVPPRIARQTASAKETVPEAIPVAQTDPARSRAASALGPPIADGKAQSLVERQYLQAAQAGDPAAMRSLAALLSRQGRHAEAERWRRHADAADTRPGGRHAPPDRRPPRGDFAGHPTSPRPDAHRYPHSTTTHRSADNGSVPRLNTWALVALVMGILAPFTCGLAAIPAVITGHIGWKQVDLRGERGQGFALTGIVLGWFMITAVVFITAALTPWEG